MDDEQRVPKRQRVDPVSIEDIMMHARVIWQRDPNKARAEQTEDTTFREYFGVSAVVCLMCWDMLLAFDLTPDGGCLHHYLWALMWMKVYARMNVMAGLCGGIDKETMMKWVMKFVYAIAYLESHVVSYCLLLCLVALCYCSHALPTS